MSQIEHGAGEGVPTIPVESRSWLRRALCAAVLPLQFLLAWLLIPIFYLVFGGDDIAERIYPGDEWPRYPRA